MGFRVPYQKKINKTKVKVFPNPTNGIIYIGFNTSEYKWFVLFDKHGKKVSISEYWEGYNRIYNLEISYLQLGVCFLVLDNYTHKILIL